MSFNPPTHFFCSFHLQLLIAFCLETEQGHWKVATIYVIGGISGSLATLYLQPELSLMGASAGVYALLMSHIPHLLKVSEAYSMPSTPPNRHWTNIPHLCVCVFNNKDADLVPEILTKMMGSVYFYYGSGFHQICSRLK